MQASMRVCVRVSVCLGGKGGGGYMGLTCEYVHCKCYLQDYSDVYTKHQRPKHRQQIASSEN